MKAEFALMLGSSGEVMSRALKERGRLGRSVLFAWVASMAKDLRRRVASLIGAER